MTDGPELPAFVQSHQGGTRLRLLVQPRASRTEVAEVVGDRLKIRVCGPPVDDRANQELCRFLSRSLRVPHQAVSLVAGSHGRRKDLVIGGVRPADLLVRLGLVPGLGPRGTAAKR